MEAVLMTSPGDPQVLQLREVPEPKLAHDQEILVKLKAAGVNPVDIKLRSRGTYYPNALPCILGCEGAGIVEKVGDSVSRFKVGDEVYFCHGGIGGHPGNYAQYATVHENFAAFKPKSIDFVHAAAAPLVMITAWESLFDRATIQATDKILIHAGAGGVGHVAIQLAHMEGAVVATTVSTGDKARFVSALGAEKVVYYTEQDFVKEMLDWTDGEGLDFALDTVGGATLSRTFSAMKVYGEIVSLLQPATDCQWAVARSKNLRFAMELMLTPMFENLTEALQHHAHILQRCAEHIDAGRLNIHVSETYALSEAALAHQRIQRGGMMGKLVLSIPD